MRLRGKCRKGRGPEPVELATKDELSQSAGDKPATTLLLQRNPLGCGGGDLREETVGEKSEVL